MADLMGQIADLRSEIRELQRKQVPGQLTGNLDDGETRFWSFVDKSGFPTVAEDAATGYGLATPLVNPVLYYVGTGALHDGGWNYPWVQDGVTWNRDWFGHVPNVNPFVAVSLFVDIAAGVTFKWRLLSNGNTVLHESPEIPGPYSQWHHSPPIKFQLANPGEVSFIALDSWVRQASPTAKCQYSFGGAYGRNSFA